MLILNTVYRVLTVFITFLTTLVISRLAGVEGYGLLSLMIVNGALFNLFTSFGVDAGITYHTAAGSLPGAKIISFIRLVLLIQLILLAITEWVSFSLYGEFWILKSDQLKQFWLIVLFVTGISLTEKYSALLNGLHLFSLCSKILFYSNVVFLLVFSLLYFAGTAYSSFTYQGVYAVLFFLQSVAFIVVFLYVRKKDHVFAPVKSADLRLLFTYSLVTLLTNSIQFLAYRIDYWFLDYYRGEKELGWYSLAVKLVQFLWILPVVLGGIILPLVAASQKQVDKDRLLSLLRIMYLLNSLAAILLFLSCGWLIPFLFGQAFDQSALLFRVLLPGVLLFGGATIFASYFAGINRLWVNFFASVLCLSVIVVLDIILIPSMGMQGAAIASTVGYGITALYYIIRYNMEERSGFKKIFVPARYDWLLFRQTMSNFFSRKKI